MMSSIEKGVQGNLGFGDCLFHRLQDSMILGMHPYRIFSFACRRSVRDTEGGRRPRLAAGEAGAIAQPEAARPPPSGGGTPKTVRFIYFVYNSWGNTISEKTVPRDG